MRAILALALLCAAPAAAQQPFALPQGCEGYVTIQKRGCQVSHLFRCESDPEGWQRRVDLDDQGLTYAGAIDAETRWVESWSPASGLTDRLIAGETDPASFTELTESGVDTFDFVIESQPGGIITLYRGQDRLTGETVEIDGVTLERTEFAVTALDPAGNELWRTTGSEYIHRDWRTFMAGTRTVTTADDQWDSDNSPVEFIFPGEAGFLSSTARHDCGVMMSAVPGMGPAIPAAYRRTSP